MFFDPLLFFRTRRKQVRLGSACRLPGLIYSAPSSPKFASRTSPGPRRTTSRRRRPVRVRNSRNRFGRERDRTTRVRRFVAQVPGLCDVYIIHCVRERGRRFRAGPRRERKWRKKIKIKNTEPLRSENAAWPRAICHRQYLRWPRATAVVLLLCGSARLSPSVVAAADTADRSRGPAVNICAPRRRPKPRLGKDVFFFFF